MSWMPQVLQQLQQYLLAGQRKEAEAYLTSHGITASRASTIVDDAMDQIGSSTVIAAEPLLSPEQLVKAVTAAAWDGVRRCGVFTDRQCVWRGDGGAVCRPSHAVQKRVLPHGLTRSGIQAGECRCRLVASHDTLYRRVTLRQRLGNDASEAGPEVLALHMNRMECPCLTRRPLRCDSSMKGSPFGY